MRPLAIASIVLMMVLYTKMESTAILDDILVYPVPAPVKIVKRETSNDSQDNKSGFLEEKLSRQSEVLEHISQAIDNQSNMIRQLIRKIVTNLMKPELPSQVRMQKKRPEISRRSNTIEETENPLIRLGKNISKYGKLATDLFMKEMQTETDPTPLVEGPFDNSPVVLESYRRTMGDSPEVVENNKNPDEPNPWCEAALVCKKDNNTICGFDDRYGYGKFDDICHMLNVNCYYKYSFVLAHTCHPTL